MIEAISVEAGRDPSSVPEVTHVAYDRWTLRVTCLFEKRRGPVYVDFEDVAGIRVLDENQLLEFWAPESRPLGWLWEIAKGGWFSLEGMREGFTLQHMAYDKAGERRLREFLVLGINDCVGVLAWAEPRVIATSER